MFDLCLYPKAIIILGVSFDAAIAMNKVTFILKK